MDDDTKLFLELLKKLCREFNVQYLYADTNYGEVAIQKIDGKVVQLGEWICP